MTATDRLDVTQNPGLPFGAQTADGWPIRVSQGQIRESDFLAGLSPHTVHNLSISTRAQTCDLRHAREAVDLYYDEMVEALVDKDYEHALRSSRRMAAFEARARELEAQDAYFLDLARKLSAAGISPVINTGSQQVSSDGAAPTYCPHGTWRGAYDKIYPCGCSVLRG